MVAFYKNSAAGLSARHRSTSRNRTNRTWFHNSKIVKTMTRAIKLAKDQGLEQPPPPPPVATIQDLLNELNGNAEQVNRCSKIKSELLKQLQRQMAQMDELTTVPVLSAYFDLLMRLERCQWKIEQHQMEKSDIMSEMYLTQQIILNMIQMKDQTSGRFFHHKKLELKKNLAKLKQQQSSESWARSTALLLLGRFLRQGDDLLKLTAHQKRCSLRHQPRSAPSWLPPVASGGERSTEAAEAAQPDPYIETVEQMKNKLALLQKHRQHNEACIRELLAEFRAYRQRLKQFYQEHCSEMIRNKHLLDSFLQHRVQAQDTQAKVCRMEEQIRHHRHRYRNTMNKIRVLSHSMHQSRGNQSAGR